MDPIIHIVIVLGLAALFAKASLHKWQDLASFEGQLTDYDILPTRTIPVLSKLFPAIEIIIAAAVLMPTSRAAGITAAITLLLIYAAAMSINIGRGRRHIDCGCSGPANKQPLSVSLVVRNLVLSLFAVVGLIDTASRVMSASDWLVIFLAVVTTSLFYGAINQLIANREPLSEGMTP